MTPLGLLYDDDGYVETTGGQQSADMPTRTGLIGRQVAGQEFLNALFTFGGWEELVVLVRTRPSAETLSRFFAHRTSNDRRPRRLRLVPDEVFPEVFHPDPPARLIFNPCPPDLRYAWTRHHRGSNGYALCGITHSLSSQRVRVARPVAGRPIRTVRRIDLHIKLCAPNGASGHRLLCRLPPRTGWRSAAGADAA